MRARRAVEISFDATSINSGTPAFDKHLQSADLFNAAQHPKITFVSDKFSFNGDKVSEVSSQLTLLGKTAPSDAWPTSSTATRAPCSSAKSGGGDFEATIDRTQWA